MAPGERNVSCITCVCRWLRAPAASLACGPGANGTYSCHIAASPPPRPWPRGGPCNWTGGKQGGPVRCAHCKQRAALLLWVLSGGLPGERGEEGPIKGRNADPSTGFLFPEGDVARSVDEPFSLMVRTWEEHSCKTGDKHVEESSRRNHPEAPQGKGLKEQKLIASQFLKLEV